MLIHSSLYSQIGGLLPTKKEVIEDNDYLSQNRYVPTETILENTIDPNEYIVGPGDEFAFNMLSSDGIVSLVLKISPTGEVLIPAVGVIFIDKMILVDAFKKIKTMCLEKYSNAKINLTLVKIRLFKIQVIGSVHKPGFMIVSPVLRVSDVFDLVMEDKISIQNPDKIDVFENTKKKIIRSKISIRNIILWRNTNPIQVDIVKFNMYGNKELNPTLMQGDIIEFKMKKETVGIFGGVEMPGNYEHREGESIFDIINLAGGFTKNADTNKVEIIRFLDFIHKESINLDSFQKLQNTIVHPEDHILVRFFKDYKRQDLVQIMGEINYPGVYSIDVGKTTIGDIIKKAGGYTTKADSQRININNIKINTIPDIEYKRISLIPNEDRSDEEKSYIKARSRTKKGHLGSNSKKHTQEVKLYVLNANDIIKIPQYFEFVEILGAVANPGRYPFIKSMNVYNYVEMAGGITKTATRKKYIIKSGTGLRLPLSKKIIIENGDIIIIAEKLEFNTWNRIQEIMTTLGQMAAIIMVIQNAIR